MSSLRRLALLFGIVACSVQPLASDGGPRIPDAATDRDVADLPADRNDADMCGESMLWDVIVDLDHADCLARPTTECTLGGGSEPLPLAGQLLLFAKQICQLPSYRWVRVEFSEGCPASLSVRAAGPGTLDPQLVDCLVAALSTQRWRCADEPRCAVVEWDTLA